MNIVGKINLEKVNIVDRGTIFAYSEDGKSPQLYMKIDLHDEFYEALKQLIAPEEELLPSFVVAFNLNDNRLVLIPKNTRVVTYPTATINLTSDNCPNKK